MDGMVSDDNQEKEENERTISPRRCWLGPMLSEVRNSKLLLVLTTPPVW